MAFTFYEEQARDQLRLVSGSSGLIGHTWVLG